MAHFRARPRSLAFLLPLAWGCGAPTEPLTSEQYQPAVGVGDAGAPGVPNIGPLNGARDAGPPLPAPPPVDAATPTTCEVKTVQTSPSIPDMLIVLDRSGSMNPGRNSTGTDRWSGSVSAVSDVVTRFDSDIHFGLMTFPALGASDGCAAGSVNVPVGADSGAAIAGSLRTMNANGSTPTAATLAVAGQTLGPVLDQGPDVKVPPKYVLLVTDGDPNCSSASSTGGSGIDQAARDQTIAAIDALSSEGIKTYVVGFQTAGTAYEGQLDAMAMAGNTGANTHRSVSSGQDLAAALEEVIRQVTSCDFTLDSPVKNASYVAVDVDGTLRGLDQAADGWKLGADKQTVTLTGAACDAIKNGSTLQIEVRCQIVTLN